MKFTATLSYSRERSYRTGNIVTTRPNIGYEEEVVSETKPDAEGRGGQVVVSYTVESREATMGGTEIKNLRLLNRDANQVITAKNADQVWDLVKSAFPINELERHNMDIITRLLAVYGWSDCYQNFIMELGQEAWGFMGGTGCGNLVHKLLFDKALGVLPELTGTRKHLSTLLFSHYLGKVKQTREDNKHLRDAVSADDVFVTFNARPICQATVRYVGASGYPVRGADQTHCSCTKCAAKLGIKANTKRVGIAIKTPDVLEYKGFTFTYVKVGGSAVLKVTTTTGALVDRKTLNASIKERGQGGSYNKPNYVNGIYYVSALKLAVEDKSMLTIKMGREPKDNMFEKARILADADMLLVKGA